MAKLRVAQTFGNSVWASSEGWFWQLVGETLGVYTRQIEPGAIYVCACVYAKRERGRNLRAREEPVNERMRKERTSERETRARGWQAEGSEMRGRLGSLYHVPSVNTSPPSVERNYKIHVTSATPPAAPFRMRERHLYLSHSDVSPEILSSSVRPRSDAPRTEFGEL